MKTRTLCEVFFPSEWMRASVAVFAFDRWDSAFRAMTLDVWANQWTVTVTEATDVPFTNHFVRNEP